MVERGVQDHFQGLTAPSLEVISSTLFS